MSALLRLIRDQDDTVTLDVAALAIAAIEHPDLNAAPSLALLDSHSRELGQIAGRNCAGPTFVARANEYFFESLGFHGNQEDYYSPRNSCLNDVLLDRTGIPITLAVVYMEVCRRLERPVRGIGLPGHFLVQYEDGEHSEFIDCFHGRTVSVEECRQLALDSARVDIFAVPAALAVVSPRQIILRMLNNLRNAYARSGDRLKGFQVEDLLRDSSGSPGLPLQ